MARYCDNCGHPLGDNATFCDKCGKRIRAAAAPKPPAPPAPPQPQPAPRPQAVAPAPAPQPAAPAGRPRKSRTGLFLGLGLGAVAIVVVVVIGLVVGAVLVFSPGKVELTPFPDELKVSPDVKVTCDYDAPDTIIPANYRSMDYVVFMQCYTDRGRTKVMVSVEIPGFTQKYEQMVEVSRAETELAIHPPLLADAARTLGSSKDAQIVITVTDTNTEKVVLQDTKPVKLYSRNDIQWASPDGTPYSENILAWVTPEAPEIDKMLRDTADSLSELTDGAIDAIVGYQPIGNWSAADITYAQVCSMMYTLAHKYQVKYVAAPFSATDSSLQSVKTPAQVIQNKAGLCVETAVTMASAIERTSMHAVVLLLPGHSQVAVETWRDSGEYLLIETTALDAANVSNFSQVVTYMSKDQWSKYMAQDGVVAIDCDLAGPLNIKSID